MKKNTLGDVLMKEAMADAVRVGLRAKPVIVHFKPNVAPLVCYEIDGEIYTMETAVDKILGQYSWWNEL